MATGDHPNLNTLSYGLLSILTVAPCSGYDLMLNIHLFWQAKHSQIYPLLAELERQGLVEFELVEQTNKPDKKVYSITESGEAAVRSWIPQPTADPVTRDEFTLKLFCVWISDPQSARQLLLERETMYRNKMCRLEKSMAKIHGMVEEGSEYLQMNSRYFGAYALVQRGLMLTRTNLEWIEWMLQILGNSEGKEN